MTERPTPPITNIKSTMKRKRRIRLTVIFIGLFIIASAVGLVLYALPNMTNLFRMPSEITAEDMTSGRPLRLGGFVEEGSVKRENGTKVEFKITDFSKTETVTFTGLLPDLFREGQGIIAEGRFDASGAFIADRVLAKHDETYVPKEIVDRLKKQGLWEAYQNRGR